MATIKRTTIVVFSAPANAQLDGDARTLTVLDNRGGIVPVVVADNDPQNNRNVQRVYEGAIAHVATGIARRTNQSRRLIEERRES